MPGSDSVPPEDAGTNVIGLPSRKPGTPEALFVRVYQRHDGPGLGAFSLWVAVANSTQEAVAAVEASMSPAERAKVTEMGVLTPAVSPETVQRLRLAKGEAWRL